jgi:hypothetical protein
MDRSDDDSNHAARGSGLDGPGISDHPSSPQRQAETEEERWIRIREKFKNLAARLVLIVITAAIPVMILIVIGISVHVPKLSVIIIGIASPVIALIAAWKKPDLALARAWHSTVIIGLAGITAVAIWIGFQDVVWAVSLPAQILGVFFILASIVTLIGTFLVAARALPFGPNWVRGDMQTACIAGAAAAGLYVGLTIVAYSFRYEPGKGWLFAILAVGCLVLAIRTMPAAWKTIGNFVKGTGITLALLGAAASFWFQSIYLPENVQEGIQYGVSVNSAVTSGSGMIVTLNFTMENQSPVTAITLGTMVIVSELLFPASSNSVPQAIVKQNINNYAKDLFVPPPGAAPPNPDVGASGNEKPIILTILQPVGNDSDLHPDDTVSREFEVVIPLVPKPEVVALEVDWHVLYARSTRLTLGRYHGSYFVTSDKSCGNYEQSVWAINQSALVRFTRGAQIFYSLWCTNLPHPTVEWNVQAAGKPYDTLKVQDEIGADIGLASSNRGEMFVLPGT